MRCIRAFEGPLLRVCLLSFPPLFSSDMAYSKALVGIYTHAEPTVEQQRVFKELAHLYADITSFVMAAWMQRVRATPCRIFTDAEARYLTNQFHFRLQQLNLTQDAHQDMARYALRDLLRRLREHYHFGGLLPEEVQPPNTVRFYRYFDVRVSGGVSHLPELGSVAIGRFPYFKGKIICTGLEEDSVGTIRASVLYEPVYQPVSA